MGYIYKIENNINNKIYIGKTERVNPITRWKEHIAASKKEKYLTRALYKAINKYGVENFTFTVIEETNDCENREKYYIALYDTFKNGYNETLGGDGKARLQLNEKRVCTYYKNHTLKETAKHYGVDPDSIEKILHRNGVERRSVTEANQFALGKTVNQIDLTTGKIINTYVSTAEAERAMTGKVNHGSNVSRVCRGQRKQYKGYKWEYVA